MLLGEKVSYFVPQIDFPFKSRKVQFSFLCKEVKCMFLLSQG